MIVRFRRIGNGTKDDQFRVPLPRYTLVQEVTVGANVFHDVEIPDIMGAPFNNIPIVNVPEVRNPQTGELIREGYTVRVAIPAPALRAFTDALDEIYIEHRGEYRPST